MGGLFNAFNAIFTSIVLFLNYNGLYQMRTSKLFRVESLSDHIADQEKRDNTSSMLRLFSRGLRQKVGSAIDEKSAI